MNRSSQHDLETPIEARVADADATIVAGQRWTRVQKEVARVAPRLRELATQALLLGPIIGVSEAWSGGGNPRGC